MPDPSPTKQADFEHAILPHLDAAHNLARWLMRDAISAEDVVQDAVVRALSYFGSSHHGNARAWLLRIVRNAAYDALARLRQGGPGMESGSSEIADPADDPEQALGHQEGLAQLDDALAALPVELRECLVLREIEGMSYKEMSQVVGAPVGTVMSRLWRARQAMIRRAGSVTP